ncbi:tetratricopeptide repeat protein [Marinospirillum insulare]|uniref:Tetratricopeptide repeat-containing protein n=1 Tax=Marinospirillum insulare TaxID=217169 RepID=A0ABQ5ZYF3_9GAMM|nr:hypothetical protein [Marinospirillum insulare]GLR65230.1 hypothetical protein GCM10007878_26690 [Marinospirillum insulare]
MKRFILAMGLLVFSGFIQAESVALTPVQYQELHKINEALAADSADSQKEALNLGEALFKQPNGSPEQAAFVRAFVARALVQIYQQKNQPKKALDQLNRVLKEDAEHLDLASLQAVRWITLHLLTGESQYQAALNLLKVWWQDEEQPSAEANYLRAALLAQLEKWSAAEPWLLAALKMRQPDSWLSLGVAVFQRQEKWAKAAKLQHQRLVLAPEKPQLWKQLAQLQLLAGQDKPALVTLELAQEKGYLNNKEQVQLARRLLANQQPLRAAAIIEEQLANKPDNLKLNKLAAQAWLQTSNQDSTQQALERLAKLGQSNQDWQRLGDWQFSQGNWQAAIDAWLKVTDQPEGKHKARLELLIANAYIEMQEYDLAKTLLENLLASNEADTAKQWLNYLKAL